MVTTVGRMWERFERYLDNHWHLIVGEHIYFWDVLLEPYRDIEFPDEFKWLARLLHYGRR
ncbi:hypothetical protein LCGC14_1251310 [marine sediment metagenome]|uniref:Uncharacterized protein n=1 Tax=marine sediment metagenome TaxID=412755 RepID=A0A0F9P6W2_9ZZZZ